jgi:hypothetical protein
MMMMMMMMMMCRASILSLKWSYQLAGEELVAMAQLTLALVE